MALTHYDPNCEGLNDDVPVGRGTPGGTSIADRMYRRLHEENNGNVAAKPRTGPKVVRPPVALLCYLCGQQFGTASLGIHQKQCYTKKLLQWERGDPETRGPRPVLRTQELASDEGETNGEGGVFTNMSQKQMEEFNNNQFQEFQEQSLVPCENCGRTFFPDRLQVHLRSCKPGASAKPVRRSVEPSSPPNQVPTSSSSYSALDERPIAVKRPPTAGTSARSGSHSEGSPLSSALRTHQNDRGGEDHNPSYDDRPLNAYRPSSPQPYAATDSSIADSESTDGFLGNRESRVSSLCDVPVVTPQSTEASPEGRRPTIPNLNLRRGVADGEEPAHSPLDPDPYTMDMHMDGAGGLVDGYNGDGPSCEDRSDSYAFMEEGNRCTSPSAPQQAKTTKPKPVIDKPLDLSHVQSRFKSAAINSLERCQYCNRTFAPDRLAKHEEVCLEKKRSGGVPIGVTPRVGVAKVNDSISRPPSSSGPAARSGAVTSRVTGSGGYGSANRDNGPMTTRGGPSTGTNKIIRPANAPSRPQSPSAGRSSSRSPPPGVQRGSVERGATVAKGAPVKIIQPAARHPSPPRLGGTERTPVARGYSQVAPHSVTLEEARPKFCTECGTKLFAVTQKYCGECGHRIGS